MNEQILLVCDIYSVVPLAIYFAMFYMGIYTGNVNEALGFCLFFYVNNEITSIIKKLPYPESLWDVTRRPEGSFNTDYLSRNGPSKKDAPGFPSGHMTSMAAFANVNVRGHYRQNGTYVRPHYRTSPNSSIYDNWSTKGNTNPYTGRKGYKSYRY